MTFLLDCYSTNATVTKIRAIHGKMFNRENYHIMVSMRSVSEITEYLKRSSRFKEVLRDVDPNTIHRGFLEDLLKKSNFETYVKLCSFQGLDKLPFYNFLIEKSECEQLLNLVNALNSGLDKKFIGELPGYVIKHSDLDMLALSKTADFDDLLSKLKGTPYLKVLRSVKRGEDGKADYTDCELKLRTNYYRWLLENIEKSFSGSDVSELKKLIFSEVDIINIINAYRLKAFFGYNAQQIKESQLPFTRIGKAQMNRYYESDTPEEMIQRLEKMIYGRHFQGDYEHIETKVNLCTYHLMEHTVARSTSAPVSLYAFMKLCDIEVGNIVHIIEGVRYDVDPAMLEGKLIIC